MGQERQKLIDKLERLRNQFQDKSSFTIADANTVLLETPSTLNWTLHHLTRKSHIARINRGLYTFQYARTESVQPILSPLASKLLNIMDESGHYFFISGLDILSVFMEHVPETYPVLMFVEKTAMDDIADMLSKSKIAAVSYSQVKDYRTIQRISSASELVLLIHTLEFTYAANGLASFEKAFVDLYYEVSRRDYPLPIQELVRIYLNMQRRLALNTSRMIKIASRRNIHQDIRHIVESDTITNAAKEFAQILNKHTESLNGGPGHPKAENKA